MNRTSPSSRLVSSAARSPDLAITGPEVARKPTPISRARIPASVVLPSPGGPKNSTWSSASPRALGGVDEHAQILARALLADELVEALRPKRGVGVLGGALGRGDAGGVGGHLLTLVATCISARNESPLASRQGR